MLTLLPLLHHYSYEGLFLLLAAGAIVVPIPEEITLLTGGYLVALGFINIYLGIAVSILGLLAGDCLLFFLALFGTNYAQKLRARVNKIGLDKTWLFSPKHALRPVLLLRFLTGIRFIAPIYAGFEGVDWRKYIATDLLSLIIFVPIMFLLGDHFHASIIAFIAGFEVVRHSVFIIVLALAGAGMLPSFIRWFRSKTGRSS